MNEKIEYIVTLHNLEDLDSFYEDMENPGGILHIPDRQVEVANRRPISRSTHYWLTEDEANQLKNDSRVRFVEPHPKYLGVKAGELEYTQTSSNWNKSGTTSASHRNWALLRCYEGADRSNWGSNGTNDQTGTIKLTATGKNVDLVIVDGDGVMVGHPEYAKNADGSGGSRFVQYNWYQHDPQVKGTGAITYTYSSSTYSTHATHVMGTAGGNTQGWARDANLYNLSYYAGAFGDDTFPYVMDYVREFHRTKPINSAIKMKNPTITNNSWGMSIFPDEWSFNDISAVTYRGTRYVATGVQGFSGVCNTTTKLADLVNFENGGNRITTTGTPSASVSSIALNLQGGTGLTSDTIVDVGSNDDGYFIINLPFNISYLGTSYSTVYIGTNFYITFGSGSDVYQNISETLPALNKICLTAADNSVQRIYYGVSGSSPNRTYRVRVEGSAGVSGTLGYPSMVYEIIFYEATPAQIDLHVGVNGRAFTPFSSAQLQAWGFVDGARIPKRVNALDSDVEQAIKEGILYVCAAGNGYWKHDIPGGIDWNNSFEMRGRYPLSVSNPYYYMRGTSPTANDTRSHPDGTFDINNICVGSIDVTVGDYKATYSDCGPGVDIFAPGTNIISSYNSGVVDPRGANYYYQGKISGTSMASPQVSGVLACMLELYPHWNQHQAKQYILGVAKNNQITDTAGGPTDYRDLQGAADKYLFYRQERPDNGTTFPKLNYDARPSSGAVYPRTRRRRY